jgi:hypothetical protein
MSQLKRKLLQHRRDPGREQHRDAACQDDQERTGQHHRKIIGELATERSRSLDTPNIVERAFDIADDLDDRPKQYNYADSSDGAALGILQKRLRETDDSLRDLFIASCS